MPLSWMRSSSPDEGDADGQQRQDPADRPAYASRTPEVADRDGRCRGCHYRGGDGLGNGEPLVDL